MLLNVDRSTMQSERVRGVRLFDAGLKEIDLQQILFSTLDRLIPDEELLVIMQSARWREEPDIMAVDKFGTLYIFELKAWESAPENLLQVLRYGQLFGKSTYSDLNAFYKKRVGGSQSLLEAHCAKFDVSLRDDEFNARQVFVVITNGLDYKTREAISYWHSVGLDVRPWVYRPYLFSCHDKVNSSNISGEHSADVSGDSAEEMFFLEINPFRVGDNPYEDIAEGYYILNTNYRNSVDDHNDMLAHKKAAAYYDPWKYKIERLSRGDVVFLYQSGVGIVAFGETTDRLYKCDYHGDNTLHDEEYYKKLTNFRLLDKPLSAAEIKSLTGNNYVFMGTLFGLDAVSGKKLKDMAMLRSK